MSNITLDICFHALLTKQILLLEVFSQKNRELCCIIDQYHMYLVVQFVYTRLKQQIRMFEPYKMTRHVSSSILFTIIVSVDNDNII